MSSIRYDLTLCNFSLLGMLEDKQHLHLDTFTDDNILHLAITTTSNLLK